MSSTNTRRPGGRETWHRLLDWDRGDTDSEWLASRLLITDGYVVDPSHPQGGPDGGKDSKCSKDGKKWACAVYFPRGEVTAKAIKKKFKDDLTKIKKLGFDGVIFFTNQEITLSEREKLRKLALPLDCEIYHIERICGLLDSPSGYGLRLEYLSMEMSKEEQVAFFNGLTATLEGWLARMEGLNGQTTIPVSKVPSAKVETSYESGSLGYRSRMVECKKCRAVFRAIQDTIMPLTAIHGLETPIHTVTCPSCQFPQILPDEPIRRWSPFIG